MMQSTLRRFLTCVTLLLAAASLTVRAEDNELVIITPHNLQIQEEFEAGFSEHIGAPAKIRWIKQGTSELLQMLETLERNKSGESFGFDLFFGGGPADHLLAANRGYSQPAALDSTLLAAIPERVAGFKLYDKDRRWCATALSSFGILLNQQVLKRQGLPAIETWKDLADPMMQSWVVIADPRKSSSVQVCYEAVIQQYGWEEGWPVLMQIAANSRFIADSSGGVPNEIAVGSALAGPCIDFYAYARIDQAGTDVLRFVCPKGGTPVTPDPVSLLRKPPNPELAVQFMNYVISPAGQKLWTLPAGAPGGPKRHRLYRTPVRGDVFADTQDGSRPENFLETLQGNALASFDPERQRSRNLVLAELMGATLIDQHDDLVEAWKQLIESGHPSAAVEVWTAPLISEEDSFALAAQLEAGGRAKRGLIRDWRRTAAEKYERVRALSK